MFDFNGFNFNEVEGNERLVANLRGAIKAGRVSHSYIFSGEVGIGKKLIAGCFAKALQCQRREEGASDACGVCVSCKTFESGSHPDMFFVAPEKTKSIVVDDVREKINARMETRPYSGRYKIFIVENADKMSAAAQNALLKTIEEPASYGVFLLLCANHKTMLPTVLSRCVVLKPRPVAQERAAARLAALTGVDRGKAALYAGYTTGNIGRSLTLLNDEEFSEMREAVSRFAPKAGYIDETEIFGAFAALEPFKERAKEALDLLHLWFRDAAVLKETGSDELLTNKDMVENIGAFARGCSMREILSLCGAVALAGRQLAQNAAFQLVVEVMLLKLIEARRAGRGSGQKEGAV
jgi:DNA polymerase-3 subunit delta'